MSDYNQEAIDFLEKTNTEITINFIGKAINHKWNEKNLRNTYRVTLSNANHTYTFTFWDSLHNTEILEANLRQYYNIKYKKRYKMPFDALTLDETRKIEAEFKKAKKEAKPTVYDVLACLTTWIDDTFKDFCDSFGYDTDSRRALQLYLDVQEEYTNLRKLFTGEELEALAEIQ